MDTNKKLVSKERRRTPIPAELAYSRSQLTLIKDVWKLIRYLKRDEKLTALEMSRRLNLDKEGFRHLLGKNIRLSQLAQIMHVMGKKVKLVVEDEV